jgi:hypothetical protein
MPFAGLSDAASLYSRFCLLPFAFCLLGFVFAFVFRLPLKAPVMGRVASGELALEIAASVRSRFSDPHRTSPL